MSTSTRPAPAQHRGERPGYHDPLLFREIRGRAGLLLFAVLAVAVAAVLLLRLFAGGVVGMSDQGDGTRLLCSLGLREGNPYNSSTTDYLYPVWYDHQWYGEDCGAQGTGEPYNSSELYFVSAATWLTHTFTATQGLDLRFLGVIFSLLVGVLVAGLAVLIPGRLLVKLLAAAALTLVVADGAFAGYFVSAYSEPAGFVGLLALTLAVLVWFRTVRVHWWSVALVVAATALAVTAKTQTASLLATVIPVLLARPSWGRPPREHPVRVPAQRNYANDWDDLTYDRIYERAYDEPEPDAEPEDEEPVDTRPPAVRWVAGRWPALLVSVALLLGTGLYLHSQPERFTVQNDYTAVFVEMLPHSPHPAQDLKRLGLPASMATSSGYPINATGSAASQLGFYDFTAKAGLLDRMKVYAAEPARLVGMMSRGLAGMAVLRANYIYSYPPDSGHGPRQFECRVCVLQKAWTAAFGGKQAMFVFLLLGCLGICGWTARTRSDRTARAVGKTGLFLGFSVMAQFWVVMLTEGASDLIKHMVFADFLFALTLVLSVVSVHLLKNTPHRR